MKRYILTGPPGAGKTVILRALEQRGYPVVEEAATDVVAHGQMLGDPEPWTSSRFIDDIVQLQRQREDLAAAWTGPVQVFDRSPICTLALARFLGLGVTPLLAQALERIQRARVYERRVFFVESLEFMANTEVRRISLEDAIRFGDVHEAVYEELGYELVRVPRGPVGRRAELVARRIDAWDASDSAQGRGV